MDIFKKFQVWRPVKNKWLDGKDCYMIYTEDFSKV